LDPPYLLETRVKKKIYRFEMTDRDHRRMLSAAKRLSGPVVISGYRSEMYLEELSGWSLHTRWVTTRGTPREEFLWCNRPPATSSPLSMEYSARGGNFRERQRVSRKVSRWGSDFAKLPDYERRSILLNLMEIENRLTSIPHRHD
jgi:DNA adenine methylase